MSLYIFIILCADFRLHDNWRTPAPIVLKFMSVINCYYSAGSKTLKGGGLFADNLMTQ